MSDQLNIFDSNTLKKEALISPCGKYRHTLFRQWDKEKPTVMFVMLNPSTADSKKDDPTVRRCVGFAKKWGYGGLYIGNLFDFRSTDPNAILFEEKPFSKWNEEYIRGMAYQSEKVICAWGNGKIVDTMTKRFPDYSPFGSFINKAYYLEMSQDMHPKHPLYLKSDLKPIKMFR